MTSRLNKGQDTDAGATIVFVAVVLVALLALTAFAVDFGRMYEERRQLQNGADAAALAIAEDCARGLCDGAYDEYAVAETYVDANARDGAAKAWLVDLDLTAQTVTVKNQTEDEVGGDNFDMLFAGVVGFDGFTVGAEATVAWGGLASPLATIPIIISECEWNRPYSEGGAGGGAHLFKQPNLGADTPVAPWLTPYPDWWNPGRPYDMDQDLVDDPWPVPTVLTFHTGTGNPDLDLDGDPCTFEAGQDGEDSLHGGFGWLGLDPEATEPCVAEVFGDYDLANDEYGSANENPGSSPPNGCTKEALADLLLGEDRGGSLVFVPYFDGDNGLNGANGEYRISGYGAFWVVGYNFGGGNSRDHAAPLTTDPCRPPAGSLQPLAGNNGAADRCLVGYFLDVVYSGPGVIGPGGHGITVIKFTG